MLRSCLIPIIKNGNNRIFYTSIRRLSSAALNDAARPSDQPTPPPDPQDQSVTAVGQKGVDGWEILAAVCVTRHPIICPPITPMEHTYTEHLSRLEAEQSLQCDWELQVREDEARKVLGETEEESLQEDTLATQRSALENLDVWKQELQEFKPQEEWSVPPSSVGRSPARQVVLVRQQQIGTQQLWVLPQGPWKPGETLRLTSERIVAESCDPVLGVTITGNAPIGFYKYKYPKDVRVKGYIGAKVFFFRGQVSNRVRRTLPLLRGGGREATQWLTHQQLSETLQKSYGGAVRQFLIDDS